MIEIQRGERASVCTPTSTQSVIGSYTSGRLTTRAFASAFTETTRLTCSISSRDVMGLTKSAFYKVTLSSRKGGGGLLTYSASSRACSSDRKSTRLNSSHGYISYAVFCLKKKKMTNSYKSCN